MKERVIKRSNAPKVTKKGEKRIEILRDALAQIKAEKYAITKGSYVKMDGTDVENKFETVAQACDILDPGSSDREKASDIINKLITKTRPCEVCAKGALLISSIRKDTTLVLSDLENIGFSSGSVLDVTDIFDQANLDLMEAFFEVNVNHIEEGDAMDQGYDDIDHLDSVIDDFEDKYPDPTERLIAIFQNAIKNDGVFEPMI